MRFRRFSTAFATALVLSSHFIGPLPAAEKDAAKEEFRTARRDIAARLRHRDAIERVAAVRDLHNYPTVEAVKLLLNVGFKDETPEVRTAAYNTLLDFKDDEAIARYLLTAAGKDVRHAAANGTALPMLAVLLSSNLPDVERDVTAYLDGQAASRDGLVMVTALADEIGAHGRAEDVALLDKLAALRAFDREFGLRRAVIESICKINTRDAVGSLVAILEKVQGELRGEIVQHLNDVTGERFGMEVAPWREWWKDNKDTFEPVEVAPRREGENLAAGERGRGGSMYYGLSIYAQKLVFIIDTSGSMQGPRLVAAKQELLKAIEDLPSDTQFSVVAFNSQVYPWQRQLVPANASMKRAASRWVEMLSTQAQTASYDALEAGLRFDAEALFFLTDGAPHGGKITAPPDIVTAITHINFSRRLSIYTIGIDVGPPGGLFDSFLSTLAKQNWGVYRRVD